MPKKSRASSRILSSTSRAPRSCANFSMPVRAIGRTNSGMFASLASAAAVHRTGGSVVGPRVSAPGNHRGERALASAKFRRSPPRPQAQSARRATARPVFRTHWSASPSRSRTPDTSRRPRASRARVGRPTEASSGCRTGHKGISFEAIQKLLRHMFQGPANGCSGQVLERDPPVAVPCKLGIEGDGPEAGDLEVRGLGCAIGAARANGAGIMGSPRVREGCPAERSPPAEDKSGLIALQSRQ